MSREPTEEPPATQSWAYQSGAGPLSAAGFADVEVTDAPAEHPFQVPDHARYTAVRVLGEGGMGVVEAVLDRRLGRELALKRVVVGTGPDARARLAQEAWITAQLDHPGIVAVHDAGWDAAHGVFYAMRLVRGRTLKDAMADAGPAARRELLRHLRDACEAVGYAHHQGFVHRDLKPSNIMVGAFGELQVMDWGLARPAPGPAGERWRAHLPPEAVAKTVAGSVLGTPHYMSPEAAEGVVIGPASDVWSLGVILYELLAGRRPFDGDSARSVLARVIAARPAPLADVAPDTPRPLAAIAARALAPDPADRYPDAKALADELTRYLEGNRVLAYDYGPAELLTRTARAFRVPIAAFATVGALAAVGVVAAWSEARQEADRAVAAEHEAAAQAALAQAHLARALVVQAQIATARRDRGTAEILAVEALTHGEDPVARGVLASFAGEARPAFLSADPTPDCAWMDLSGDGAWLACAREHTLELWSTAPLARAWEVELPGATSVAVSDRGDVAAMTVDGTRVFTPDGRIAVRRRPTGGRVVAPAADLRTYTSDGSVHDTSEPSAEVNADVRTMCGQAVQATARGFVSACNKKLVELDGDVLRELPSPTGVEAVGYPQALLVADDAVYLGTEIGVVVRQDRATGAVAWQVAPDAGAVHDLALAADRHTLALATVGGGVQVLDARTGRPVVAIPQTAGALRVGLSADGVLTTLGSEVRRVQLPIPGRGSTFRYGYGVTGLDVSDDGALVAASGSSFVDVRAWQTGERVLDLVLDGTGKDVDFLPGGALAYGVTPGGVFVVDDARAATSVRQLSGTTGRRVAALDGGRVVAFASDTSVGPLAVAVDGGDAPAVAQPIGQPHDLDGDPAGERAVGVDGSGAWVYRADGSAPHRVWTGDGAVAVAIAPAGDVVAVSRRRELLLVNVATGEVRWRQGDPTWLTRDVAISRQADRVALSDADGSARVFDLATGELQLVVRGQREQVASVTFTPDGAHLLTGSWDNTVRAWDLAALDADPRALRDALTAAWGLDLERVMR